MASREHLSWLSFFCIATAFWPYQLIQDANRRKLYIIFHNVTYCIVSVFTCCQFIELFRLLKDGEFGKASTNIGYTMVFMECVAKLHFSRTKRFRHIVATLRKIEVKTLSEANNTKAQQIHDDSVTYVNNLISILMGLGIITLILLIISPKFQHQPEFDYELVNSTFHQEIRFPFSAWIPFDNEEYYVSIYIFHSVAGCCALCSHLGADAAIVGFMVFVIQQLRIHRCEIRDFKKKSEDIVRCGDGIMLEDALTDEIERCIKKHQNMIRFVEDVNKLIKTVMLLSFVSSSMQMGPLLFEIVVAKVNAHLFASLTAFLALIMQMMLFYWHANDIMLESELIASAVFESDWLGCNTRIARNLQIIMMRAQKPLTLSVGPFYIMSTRTALMILKAVYSITTLFRYTYLRNRTS